MKDSIVQNKSFSIKEAVDVRYWYKLLMASEYITNQQGEQMIAMCDEIVKMLSSTIKTMREKNS